MDETHQRARDISQKPVVELSDFKHQVRLWPLLSCELWLTFNCVIQIKFKANTRVQKGAERITHVMDVIFQCFILQAISVFQFSKNPLKSCRSPISALFLKSTWKPNCSLWLFLHIITYNYILWFVHFASLFLSCLSILLSHFLSPSCKTFYKYCFLSISLITYFLPCGLSGH